MKTLLFHTACALALVGAGPALAQEAPTWPDAGWNPETQFLARVDAELPGFGPGPRTMAFISDEMGHERIVKGAPYCADALHESVQPLADGNRIVHRQVTRLCRDGEGRTRQEVEHDGGKRIYLRDPVAREAWLIDPQRKTARPLRAGVAFGHPGEPPGVDGAAWREYGERMREWARSLRERLVVQPAEPPRPPGPPLPPVGMAWSGAQPVVIVAGDPTHRLAPIEAGNAARSAELQVMRVDTARDPRTAAMPPMPEVPAMPPLLMQRLPGFAPRGAGVLSPLGSREIEGVRVDGERTTWTIESGRLGNEKPIVIAREVWTSPELLLTVQSRDFDPRSGETSYRLSKLKRGEPDPALMRVPADYDTNRSDDRGRGRPPAPPASGRG